MGPLARVTRQDDRDATPRTRRFDTTAAFASRAARSQAARWMRPIADRRWPQPFDPVDALARAMLHQPTIVGRVEAAICSARLHCDALARIDGRRTVAMPAFTRGASQLRPLARRSRRSVRR